MSATIPSAGLRDIAAAIAALDARLDQVAALGPNWDGHAATPIDPAILQAVRNWGQAMPGWTFTPAPAVVPLSSGGLQLEWHVGPRILELEFETPETVHYLRWDPSNGVQDENTYPADHRSTSEELIGWVRGPERRPVPMASGSVDRIEFVESHCLTAPLGRKNEKGVG